MLGINYYRLGKSVNLLKMAVIFTAIFLFFINSVKAEIRLFDKEDIFDKSFKLAVDIEEGIHFFNDSIRYKIQSRFTDNSIVVEKHNNGKSELLNITNQEFEKYYFSKLSKNIFILGRVRDSLVINIIDSNLVVNDKKIIFFPGVVNNFKHIISEYYLINSSLYSFKNDKLNVIDNNILDVIGNNGNLVYVKNDYSQTSIYLYYSEKLLIGQFRYFENGFIESESNWGGVSVLLSNGNSLESVVINNEYKVLYNSKFSKNKLDYIKDGNLYSIINYDGKQKIEKFDVYNKFIEFELELPDNFFNPIFMEKIKDKLIIVFSNGFLKIRDDEILGIKYFTNENVNTIRGINLIKDKLYLIKDNGYLEYNINENNIAWLKNMIQSNFVYAVPTLLIIMIFIIFQIYKQQRRVLQTFIDLPSTGMVLLLSPSGDLLRLNNYAREVINLNENVPLKRYINYYLDKNGLGELNQLIEKALKIQDNFNQKINIFTKNQNKEFLCSINFLYSFSGKSKGILISAVDITEELERKRISNWAQLAHDMQTNLSTIRLNAEQLDLELNSLNHGRKKKIIHQVNLLIQRVRDIVTVGRSSRVSKELYSSKELIDEIYSEFENLEDTSIIYEKEFKEFKISCDKQKLIRGIRNAVENAAKAIGSKQGGRILISADFDHRNHYFKIKDNGKGMDKETKEMMLTPYFTTGNNSGGSGIGTMIMQNVIEQHGGELIINSENNKGTEVIFKIPIVRN